MPRRSRWPAQDHHSPARTVSRGAVE
jgi:hypothetical protein